MKNQIRWPYPIGRIGQAWTDENKQQWLSLQVRQRSYEQEVVEPLKRMFDPAARSDLAACAELVRYGGLDYRACGAGEYALYAVQSKHWDPSKPFFFITGGVHGYETSGVQGGIRFLQERFSDYAKVANILHIVCVSPWGYETINRWNPLAVDPNRAFFPEPLAQEAEHVIKLLSRFETPLVHIDLHETTDTDATEFRPAKAARDGVEPELGEIPDGFYLSADAMRPEPLFQKAMIDAVRTLSHIAPEDVQGLLMGKPAVQSGVIESPKRAMGICSGWTQARFVTTTEVYPDSPRLTPELCNEVQVVALCAGLDYALRTI